MSHRLYELERASRKGSNEVFAWLKVNLLRLKIGELLAKPHGNSPCQTCHEPQYMAFKNALAIIGKESFHIIISNILQHASHLTIQNASVAWVFRQWLEGHDPDRFVRPVSLSAPSVADLLNSLPPEHLTKLQNDSAFRKFVEDGREVAEALRYFGLPDAAIQKTLDMARYPREVAWLQDFVAKLESGRPVVDLTLPFEQRWNMFLDGRMYQFISCYFQLPEDRQMLEEFVEGEPSAKEIVAAIPDGKVSWKRLKKNLSTSIHEGTRSGTKRKE